MLKHIAMLELDANRNAIANGAPEGRGAFEHGLAMAVQVPDLDKRRRAELDADRAFLEGISFLCSHWQGKRHKAERKNAGGRELSAHGSSLYRLHFAFCLSR